MTYYLLTNPNSGNKLGKITNEIVENYLKNQRIDFKTFFTVCPGDEKNKIQEILALISPDDSLIIIGGDGTLSLSIKFLPSEFAFSYIPAGSGNDFARAANIPINDPILALKGILKKEDTIIYVLSYKSEHFHGIAMNNVGIGLDGAIIEKSSHSLAKKFFNKIKLGQLSHLFITLQVLFQKKAFQITVNQKKNYSNAFLFVFSKHPYFGGGIRIAPHANNLNPQISLIEIDKIPRLEFFGLLKKLIKAQHLSDPRIHSHTADNFHIQLKESQPMQIDGEAFTLPAYENFDIWSEKRRIIK